uniref:Uncharacterized protein n=1 Tax=Oryza punctata TaxID=4537 RepID=A0A0E0KIN3_ORYPU
MAVALRRSSDGGVASTTTVYPCVADSDQRGPDPLWIVRDHRDVGVIGLTKCSDTHGLLPCAPT